MKGGGRGRMETRWKSCMASHWADASVASWGLIRSLSRSSGTGTGSRGKGDPVTGAMRDLVPRRLVRWASSLVDSAEQCSGSRV